jgi:hypothetical protein
MFIWVTGKKRKIENAPHALEILQLHEFNVWCTKVKKIIVEMSTRQLCEFS